MFDIGVIGGDEAVEILQELYAMSENPAVRVSRIDPDSPAVRFQVLIINDAGFLAPAFLEQMTSCDMIALNADNKALYPYLSSSRSRLITYGFNGKACVTASSVVDEAYECIQLCIQRGLPTLTGQLLEPQEFAVSFHAPKNIYCALGAATAALVAGLTPENFSL